MTRTVVVGLDGASWRLVNPWLESGDLPNLRAIRENGTWAPSDSCLPPVTFPNWKCYSAGKNPGKLGVFWFERIDMRNQEVKIMNGASFHTAELWDYLNRAGYRAGIVNMPTMYPPREIDGVIVCGGPDAVDGEYRHINSGYTYPSNFEEELIERFDYSVHPDPLLSSNEERGQEVDAILNLLDTRFEVALALLEEHELEFVHVTLFYLNVLQHFFWNETPTKRAWERIDKWLGRLDDLEGVDLVIMSDHGCAPTTTEFYINEWLTQNGYLTQQRTLDDWFRQIGLTRENLLRAAKRVGIVGPLARTVPERIQKLVPQSAGAKRGRKTEKINFQRTKALASGQGPVYVNPIFDVNTVTDTLVEDLLVVTDDDGDSLFRNVYRTGELYTGPYVGDGPDIVIDMQPGVHINDGIGHGKIQTAPDRWEAENERTGIFVAKGPSFENCGRIETIEILDLAPTILSSHGVSIPTDMDGRALPILSDVQCTGSQDPIEVPGRTGDAGRRVAHRLEHLGYME